VDLFLVACALFSALLHAGWNAAVKAQPDPREAMAAQMIAAAVLAVPLLGWAGLPAAASWPWLALSTTCNMVAVAATLRAYREGAFGTVYPIARATSVLGVAGVAPLLLGEALGHGAALGVALVAAALVALALDSRRAAPGAASMPPRALGWTLLAGCATAAYVLADAQGARASGSAWAYGGVASITNALAMSWVNRGLGAPWTLVRRQARVALPAGVVSTVSYLLILWVYTRAPVAPAAALRDTSAVFALLIAAVWLKEPLGPRRVAIVALALAGVPLLRLGSG
jgi:multidrug transporter EmrE-like cation transporter